MPGAHRTVPANGIAPMSALNRTVLPAAFGPKIASDVPRPTAKLKSVRICCLPNRIDR
jgi:hypothetical protein